MGVCLCKDKVQDSPSIIASGSEHSALRDPPNGQSNSLRDSLHTQSSKKSLSTTVDILVEETLDVIGRRVPTQTEQPNSMILLHVITDKPSGWIQLVRSLIRVVPAAHPMGPSVIALLLEESPLPSKDSVIEVSDMIKQFHRCSPRKERNLCVVFVCLAEKLAGPNSVAMLSPSTLGFLFDNLQDDVNLDVKLLSLIALEKFALTSENKATIKRKLEECTENPLSRLEQFATSEDYMLRQIGFCAQWCLDNYFVVEGRKYSYETVDVFNINVMLNKNDVSDYLKISPDGLEARCDAYTFESVRCTFEIVSGSWYYEVLIITPGIMQIGWATKDSSFVSSDGFGIGDDNFSIAFDGYRKLIWHCAKPVQHDLPEWKEGSVLGCYINVDTEELIFSLNGQETQTYNDVFKNAQTGFFAAASFMSFQQCRFNFGSEPFRYPPKRPFSNFNNSAHLNAEDKVLLPRHLYLENLRTISVREDSCTLCFDRKASIILDPCKHRGFCLECANQLQYCPMCRADIDSKRQEHFESPTTETLPTTC